jgi:predicted nucleic acid-binding protein
MSRRKAIFWDSCVFYRYLTGIPNELVDDIGQYISDARNGKVEILTSTIAFAEIRPSVLKRHSYHTLADFVADFKASFLPIAPTVDIMNRAAIVKDQKYPNPKGGNSRHIGTPDAIMLLTALHAQQELGYDDLVFHSFDEGTGKTWEGRCTPIIGLENWLSGCAEDHLLKQVCKIVRQLPHYPQGKLL